MIPCQQVICVSGNLPESSRLSSDIIYHRNAEYIKYAVPVRIMPDIKPEAVLKSYAGFPMELVFLVI